MGAEDYVTKPYQPEELKARVDTQIKLKQREEKLIEQEAILRQSEERFRMVSQLTADLHFYSRSAAPRLIAGCGLLGFRANFWIPIGELNNLKIAEIIHPDDRLAFDGLIINLSQGRASPWILESIIWIKVTIGSAAN